MCTPSCTVRGMTAAGASDSKSRSSSTLLYKLLRNSPGVTPTVRRKTWAKWLERRRRGYLLFDALAAGSLTASLAAASIRWGANEFMHVG